MSEWKEVRLGDILLIPSRNGLTKPSKIRGCGVKMIAMGELFAHPIIHDIDMDRVPVTDNELKLSNIEENDLLFARQSLTLEGAGKCSIVKEVNEPTVFESHLIRLRINEKLANPWYIYYYFNSYYGKRSIQNIVNQVAAAGIKGSDLVKIKVPMPSLSEQKKIADQLFEIDSKIECNRKICANLEAQAQALFKHWFIDFAPFKDGKFVESELGMIPEGWRVGRLSELIEIKYGKDHKKLDEGSIPAYGSAGLMRYVDSYLYQGESVLIPRKGTLNNIMLVNEKFWTVDTMFYTIPKCSYLLKYIYLKLSRIDFTKLNVGTSIPSNSTDQLNKMEIIIPRFDVLKRFDELVDCIIKTKKQRIVESLSLASLRDTLLPKLMSGEIKL